METKINYLKVGKATELSGKDKRFYRFLEIFPGSFSILTLLILVVFSYFKPVWVAYFIIAFDVYWLLLVIYMAIFLISSYLKLKSGLATDWKKYCELLKEGRFKEINLREKPTEDSLAKSGLVDGFMATCHPANLWRGREIIRGSLMALLKDGYPTEKMIVVLAMEERAGGSERKG